eukprot:693885-Rhodomonas_salina.3
MGATQSDYANGERNCIERVCDVGNCAQDCTQDGKLRASRSAASSELHDLTWLKWADARPVALQPASCLGSSLHALVSISCRTHRHLSEKLTLYYVFRSLRAQTKTDNQTFPYTLAVTTPTEAYGNTSCDTARSAATTPPQDGVVAWDPDYGEKIIFHRKMSPVTKTNRSATPNYVSFANLNSSELASTDLFGAEKKSPYTKFMGRSGSKLHSQ